MKFAVIGLGSFGYTLAKTLYERGNEVIVVDSNAEKVEKIKAFATHIIKMDSADKENLRALGIHEMDTIVVCLGPDMESSILTVLFLKELGAKRIVAKALTEDHAKILESVGATEVIFPERDMAIKTALKLNSPGILEYFPLTSGFVVQEIVPPKKFVSKSLRELDLRNRYGIQVVAVKEIIPDEVVYIPKADFVIKDSGTLIIIGEEKQLTNLFNKKKHRSSNDS